MQSEWRYKRSSNQRKSKEKRSYVEVARKWMWKDQGRRRWDQKTRWGEAKHRERRQAPTERVEQEDQQMHQGQKKNNTTRKYSAESRRIQRHQKFFMHKKWQEKNAHPESKEGQRREKVFANVLGDFYSKLYAEKQLGEKEQDRQNLELRMNTEKKSYNATWKMICQSSHKKKYKLPLIALNKGKASDNNGIWAEDIKTCEETTKEMVRQVFNVVLKQDDCTPETWRRIRIKVI